MLIPRIIVPNLLFPTLQHGDFNLSEHVKNKFNLIVFYRGLHCPLCANYLTELSNNLEDKYTMQRIANKIAHCARVQDEPVGGWKSVYAVLKEAHADWVRKYRNEPDGFHWYYGNLLSTAYLSGAGFQKSQEDNINNWLKSYWSWVTDTGRARE